MRRGSSSSVKVSYPRYSRQEVLDRLAAGVIALQQRLPLKRVVLFGSYASGRFTAASDIDVLVVYEGALREDAFAVVKRTLDLPRVEPHVYGEDEARRLSSTLERMTRDGVVLYQD